MPKKDDLLIQFGKYSGLAFLLPVSILVGYVIGYFLDKAFGTDLSEDRLPVPGHRFRHDRADPRVE